MLPCHVSNFSCSLYQTVLSLHGVIGMSPLSVDRNSFSVTHTLPEFGEKQHCCLLLLPSLFSLGGRVADKGYPVVLIDTSGDMDIYPAKLMVDAKMARQSA